MQKGWRLDFLLSLQDGPKAKGRHLTGFGSDVTRSYTWHLPVMGVQHRRLGLLLETSEEHILLTMPTVCLSFYGSLMSYPSASVPSVESGTHIPASGGSVQIPVTLERQTQGYKQGMTTCRQSRSLQSGRQLERPWCLGGGVQRTQSCNTAFIQEKKTSTWPQRPQLHSQPLGGRSGWKDPLSQRHYPFQEKHTHTKKSLNTKAW